MRSRRRWQSTISAVCAAGAVLGITFVGAGTAMATVDETSPQYQEPEFQTTGVATQVYSIRKAGAVGVKLLQAPATGSDRLAIADPRTQGIDSRYTDNAFGIVADLLPDLVPDQLWEFVPITNDGPTVYDGYGLLRNRLTGKCLHENVFSNINNAIGTEQDSCAGVPQPAVKWRAVNGVFGTTLQSGNGRYLSMDIPGCQHSQRGDTSQLYTYSQATPCGGWTIQRETYRYATSKMSTPVNSGRYVDQATYGCLPTWDFATTRGELDPSNGFDAGGTERPIVVTGRVDEATNPAKAAARGDNLVYDGRDVALSSAYGQSLLYCMPKDRAGYKPNTGALRPQSSLYATVRHTDGGWDNFADTSSAAQIPGSVVSVAAASPAAGANQTVAVTSDGRLWHTIRSGTGSWQGAGDAGLAAGIPGVVTNAAVASTTAGVNHVLAVTSNGKLWHTYRDASGNWQSAGDAGEAGQVPGTIVATSAVASGTGGDLQVYAVTSDGGLWQTTRHNNTGGWTSAVDVRTATAIPSTITSVSVTSTTPGETQLVALTSTGRLWHSIRRVNGNWEKTSQPDQTFNFPRDIASAAVTATDSGDLQLLTVGEDGKMRHTIRRINGNWDAPGNVTAATGFNARALRAAAFTNSQGEAQYLAIAAD